MFRARALPRFDVSKTAPPVCGFARPDRGPRGCARRRLGSNASIGTRSLPLTSSACRARSSMSSPRRVDESALFIDAIFARRSCGGLVAADVQAHAVAFAIALSGGKPRWPLPTRYGARGSKYTMFSRIHAAARNHAPILPKPTNPRSACALEQIPHPALSHWLAARAIDVRVVEDRHINPRRQVRTDRHSIRCDRNGPFFPSRRRRCGRADAPSDHSTFRMRERGAVTPPIRASAPPQLDQASCSAWSYYFASAARLGGATPATSRAPQVPHLGPPTTWLFGRPVISIVSIRLESDSSRPLQANADAAASACRCESAPGAWELITRIGPFAIARTPPSAPGMIVCAGFPPSHRIYTEMFDFSLSPARCARDRDSQVTRVSTRTC